MRLQSTDNVAAADSSAKPTQIAEPHLTVGVANSNNRSIEAQVAAAATLAELLTPATAAAAADIRADDRDRSPGKAEKTGRPSANDTDLLVAILMAHSNVTSVSELTGKTIAIDDRHSASNSNVRTAIVAAGAPEVQLSEGQTTAINRLVNAEVPAAVLALVSADAATGFPEIAGFRIFQVPLSPRALKPRF
jgi:ABC-type phosphate/phosphonate transport system substrate-binding protein